MWATYIYKCCRSGHTTHLRGDALDLEVSSRDVLCADQHPFVAAGSGLRADGASAADFANLKCSPAYWDRIPDSLAIVRHLVVFSR